MKKINSIKSVHFDHNGAEHNDILKPFSLENAEKVQKIENFPRIVHYGS